MKILIHTQYFPPEIGAPQNRLFELAVRLVKLGAKVDVLTAMPNYPAMRIHEEYKGKWGLVEEMEDMTIYRSWIYVSESKSIVKRLMNYFSFVITSFFYGLFKLGRYDLIICESPPLFLGISTFFLSRFKSAKFLFNVSDLWPESAEKLGLITNKRLLNAATVLEEWLYKKADFITGQTQGIVADIQRRFPDKPIYWLPNGVDIQFYNPDRITSNWREENGYSDKALILLYAGIMGHAQGLEVILKAANELKQYPDIQFVLVGEGPVKKDLLKLKEELQLENLRFFSAVPKVKMPEVVTASDMSIIPLKKLDLFEGAIPSKIFENLAMKKPILLGVKGEAKALFIDEGRCGLYFEPENFMDLREKIMDVHQGKINLIELQNNARNYIKLKFDREKIAASFWQFLNDRMK